MSLTHLRQGSTNLQQTIFAAALAAVVLAELLELFREVDLARNHHAVPRPDVVHLDAHVVDLLLVARGLHALALCDLGYRV